MVTLRMSAEWEMVVKVSKNEVALTLGMTAYWPFFIHAPFSTGLFVSARESWAVWYGAVMLAAVAVTVVLLYAHSRLAGWDFVTRAALATVTSLACLALAGVLIAADRGVTWYCGAVAPWVCSVVVGVLVTLLTMLWASVARCLGRDRLAVCLAVTLVLAQVVNALAISVGELLGLPDAAWSVIFPMGSALTMLVLRPVGAMANGLMACGAGTGEADENGPVPLRELVRGGCDWLVLLVVFSLYLLGSGVFRGSYKAHTGEAEAVFDVAWRVVVVLVSCAMLAYAVLSLHNAKREPYPWAPAAFFCLAVLYVALLARGPLGEACNVAVLHSRLIAVYLMWAAAESFSRRCPHRWGAVTVPALFLTVQTMVRTLASLFSDDGFLLPFSSVALDAVLALTAFTMTVGVFWWVRARAYHSEEGTGTFAIEDSPREVRDVTSMLRVEYSLTDREADVLRLLARGYTQKSIAEELGLSFNSVRTYAKGLYAKLGVHARQEVIDLVRERKRQA